MNILADRTTSALPLSIGTSLALESLLQPRGMPYDPGRVIPEMIDPSKYHSIYINISTLLRNLVGALPKSYMDTIVADHLIDPLLWEMETIESIVKEDTSGAMQVKYYYSLYEDITSKKLHKAVQIRQPNTPAQHAYHEMLVKTAEQVISQRSDVDLVKTLIKGEKTNSLIMTHIPYDLLAYGDFNSLDLLESHTGKLKHRQEWWSKYYKVGNDDMSRLPFFRKLLLIFGDHVLIKPMDVRFRRMILEIAKNRNFTPMTTKEKVRFFLDSDLKERYLFLEVYEKL